MERSILIPNRLLEPLLAQLPLSASEQVVRTVLPDSTWAVGAGMFSDSERGVGAVMVEQTFVIQDWLLELS